MQTTQTKTMRTRHLIPLLLAAPLSVGILTACDTTSSLTQLRHVLPEGGPYEVALSGMYRDYAEAELAAYDWWSSKRFADKGLYVAEGKPVAPENPADWAIPLGARPELDRAREQQAQRIVLLWPRAPGAGHRLLLQRLAEVLGPHRPGPCAVGVRYSGEQAGVSLELGDEWRVRANPVLLEALEQLVGAEGLRVAYGPPTGTAGAAYGVI